VNQAEKKSKTPFLKKSRTKDWEAKECQQQAGRH
jgi:hypothetical protein